MSNHVRKDTWKWVITFTLLIILGLGLVGGLYAVGRNVQTRELSVLDYKVGVIDDLGGYKEGNTSIYTDDYITVDGLTIKVKDDATVDYKIFFYDKDKAFLISCTNSYSNVSNAKYFRIMITPKEETEISTLQINNYSSQVSVVVNKTV